MITVWGADSGAYMFGKLFGKHKLAPKVSPVKPARLYRWTSDRSGNLMGLWHVGESRRRSVTLLICSIVAALASVLGDLTESMFKREAGIKDSGHLIP